MSLKSKCKIFWLGLFCGYVFGPTTCGLTIPLVTLFGNGISVYTKTLLALSWASCVLGARWSMTDFTGRAIVFSKNHPYGYKLVFGFGAINFGMVHLVVAAILDGIGGSIYYFPVFVLSMLIGGLWHGDFFFHYLPAFASHVKTKTF